MLLTCFHPFLPFWSVFPTFILALLSPHLLRDSFVTKGSHDQPRGPQLLTGAQARLQRRSVRGLVFAICLSGEMWREIEREKEKEREGEREGETG